VAGALLVSRRSYDALAQAGAAVAPGLERSLELFRAG